MRRESCASWPRRHGLNIPAGPSPIFSVYPCDGDCTASALVHRDELAGHFKTAGMDVDLEQPARPN